MSDVVVEKEALYRIVNGVGIITLNRVPALNSLTHNMVREIAAILDHARSDNDVKAVVFEGAGPKGFCAGGDVRTLYTQAKERKRDGLDGWLQFFVDEYTLDYAIHVFPKPTVALMHGVTMGGGMGLSQGCDLRVATTKTKIAMPETRIGLVPDVGATKFLADMRPALELYVGLTGVHLNGADAVYCGLADSCVDPESLADYESRLLALDWNQVNIPLLALRDVFAPVLARQESAICAHAERIDAHFDPSMSLADIQATLEAGLKLNSDADKEWIGAALEAVSNCSPLMLAVTQYALTRGRSMSLAQCFRQELDIVCRALDEGDFVEGVRALLVDKDKNPDWKLHGHDEVWGEHIRHFMSSPWTEGQHPLQHLGT